jgi:membrane associated rhomboid family serine protease
MNLVSTRDSWWMTQCEAALLAEGIPVRWNRLPGQPDVMLDVPTSQVEQTSEVLSEMMGEELARQRRSAWPLASEPLLLQPAFAFAVCLAVVTLAFFWVTGPAAAHSPWHAQGALVSAWWWDGQWWRAITAATLHADTAHALGNASFFLVLGWAAAERLGAGMSLLIWLLTALVGFAASLLLSDVHVTVGASGGLFGLLGAAAGHAVRYRRYGEVLRRGLLRSLGGAVLLLAFTAFSPQANIEAHVGGFVSGLLFGLLVPQRPPAGVWQWAASGVAVVAVWAAWAAAS